MEFDRVIAPASRTLERATLGVPEPYRSWLSSDVRMLLTHFARFTRARRLRVWLGAVQSDQCRKFHVDYVRYRLVTTYLGPGTEWVPDHAVCRDALQDSRECPLEANRAIVPDPSAVRRAVAGEVLLMKGARHAQQRGAVHRSPPIEGTGAVRVLLSVSSVEERE
jgi:cytochrome P450